MSPIQAVIFDWAGTMIDFGCRAPVMALREVFATRDRDDWVDALEEACAAPVLDPGELADHPQLAARGAVQRLGRTTFVRPPLAPADWAVGDVAKLGQHSAEILGEAGFSAEDLAALRGSGAVR